MAAEIAGLRFVPLAKEQFELAIPASFVSHRRVSEFLEFLTAELGAGARNGQPGYTFEGLGHVQRSATGALIATRARTGRPVVRLYPMYLL